MSEFYPSATPPHRATPLRIVCEHEGGKTGRYRLTAFDGEHWAASQLYPWDMWLGHAHGQLLVDDFVAYAEAQAPQQAQCHERDSSS